MITPKQAFVQVMDNNSNSTGIISVLKNKPFLLLWLAQVVSQIAFNMLTFILGVIVYTQTRTNTSVSLLYLTIGIPAMLSGPFSGIVVDQFNKRHILFISNLARVLILLGMYFINDNLIVLYLLTALASVFSQFFVPAEAALIPTYVPQKRLLSANALFTMTFYSAILGGFVAGGPLLSIFGERYVLLFLMVLFVISALITLFLPHSETENKHTLNWHQGISDLVEVLKFVRGKEAVFQALFLVTLAQAIIAIFATLGPGFADRILLVKLTDASLIILAPAAVGMMVGTLVVGSFGTRFGKRDLINWGILVSGLLLTFVALFIRSQSSRVVVAFFEDIFSFSLVSGLLPVSVVCFFLLGFANSLIDISCNTVLQERTDAKLRGRVYGLLGSLISGVAILPVLLSGILADVIGIGKIIFGLGIGLIVFGYFTRQIKANSKIG